VVGGVGPLSEVELVLKAVAEALEALEHPAEPLSDTLVDVIRSKYLNDSPGQLRASL
jgi:hypothetical protein